MTQLKDTPDIEKKFKDIFAGAFSKDTLLQDQVKIIAKLHQELKAYKKHVAKESLEKSFEDVSALEDKVKNIAKLIRSLKGRANRAAKKIAKDFEKIVKLNQEFKDVFPENSSLEYKVKIIVELRRDLKAQKGRKDEEKIIKKLIHNLEVRMGRAIQKIAQDFEKVAGFKHKYEGKDVFTNEKAAEFEISKKSQDTATILEGKISDQNKQEKTSVQTDKIVFGRDSVIEADTYGRSVSEDRNFQQEKIFVQTDTVQPSVSKDPIDVFGYSLSTFPENASLADKVKIILRLNQELKAYKRHIAKESLEKGFKDEVNIIKRLVRSLNRRTKRADKRVDKDFEKIVKLNREFKPENSSLENKVKSIVKLHQELKAQKERKDEVKIIANLIQDLEGRMDRAEDRISQDLKRIPRLDLQYKEKGIFTSEKAVEFEGSKKSQTTTEDRNFQQEKISVQTDTVQPSVSKDPIKDKPNDKKPEISLKQVSVDRNATEKKSNNKKSQLSEKKNIAQPKENQKEEGFLVRFLKKIFKKLFDEDKKSVEYIKGTAQKSMLNDEGQQQNKLLSNQDQSASEGLQIDNPLVTPVTKVEKTKTDHER